MELLDLRVGRPRPRWVVAVPGRCFSRRGLAALGESGWPINSKATRAASTKEITQRGPEAPVHGENEGGLPDPWRSDDPGLALFFKVSLEPGVFAEVGEGHRDAACSL